MAHTSETSAERTPRLVALADDLTGANALGAMLAAQGYRVATTLRLPPAVGADALIVDTATRDLTPAAAAARIRRAMRRLRPVPPGTLLGKRIDSTFRGPIAAELAAMLAELPAGACALVVPAAPGAGRTLVGGILHVPPGVAGGGVDVRTSLRSALHADVVHMRLHLVREGADALTARLAVVPAARVLVADAQTDGDIERVADAAAQSGRRIVPVDPGGLTSALARRLAPPPRRVVAVLGSRAALTRTQREYATARLGMAAHAFNSRDTATGEQVLACRDDVCIVHVADETRAQHLAGAIAALVAAVLAGGDVRGLFLSGGDTARRVLRRLGARGVAIATEIAPLVAFGRLVGGPWHGLPVVTKGGMVGDEAMLYRCLQLLRGGTEPDV